MQGKTVLEIANGNSRIFAGEFRDPKGAAFIGDLPNGMQEQMIQGLAHSIGGAMVNEFPVFVLKSKDAMQVKVQMQVYVFTPEELIAFAQNLFKQAMSEQALANAAPGGQG